MENNSQTKFDWPREAVLQLIEMWQKYECLYNPKHKFYHNKHARYQAFNEIANSLKVFNNNIEVIDIKNKITYLRGQYTREVSKSKEKKSGASADEVYVPSAYWFDELSFLGDFIKIRKGSSNLFNPNSPQLEDSWDSSQQFDTDISPAQPSKRARPTSETPLSSRSTSKEDSVLAAAATALESIATNAKKVVNEKDEAFCNYIKMELNEITNTAIKDRLIEKITIAIFDSKKEMRLFNNNADQQFSNF